MQLKEVSACFQDHDFLQIYVFVANRVKLGETETSLGHDRKYSSEVLVEIWSTVLHSEHANRKMKIFWFSCHVKCWSCWIYCKYIRLDFNCYRYMFVLYHSWIYTLFVGNKILDAYMFTYLNEKQMLFFANDLFYTTFALTTSSDYKLIEAQKCNTNFSRSR